jgi:hypothetical protein
VYALVMTTGWRRRLGHAAVICAAFALPIVAISFRDYLALRHFSLAPYAASTIYGRMAYAADCQTLKLPSYEKPLCPPRQLALQMGPDQLDHAPNSPLKHLTPPAGMTRHGVASDFSRRVVEQQPLRVAGSVLSDAIKLFAAHRGTTPGDTPIWRWQFQTAFPTFPPYVTTQGGHVRFAYRDYLGRAVSLGSDQDFGGGGPRVITPLTRFLRAYQLDGGYTPGPVLLGLLLAALIGSAFLLRRRKVAGAGERATATACCYLLATTVVLLLLSDAFEFSWRYQLNAIITLPAAGVLGLTLMIGYVKSRVRSGSAKRQPVTAGGPPDGSGLAVTGSTAAGGPTGSSQPADAPAVDSPASGGPVAGSGPAGDTTTGSVGTDAPGNGLAGQGHTTSDPEAEALGAGEGIEDREPQGKNRASAG